MLLDLLVPSLHRMLRLHRCGPAAANPECHANLLKGVDLFDGDLPGGDVPGTTVADCCAACAKRPDCHAYTLDPEQELCFLKAAKGWKARRSTGLVSWIASPPPPPPPPSE